MIFKLVGNINVFCFYKLILFVLLHFLKFSILLIMMNSKEKYVRKSLVHPYIQIYANVTGSYGRQAPSRPHCWKLRKIPTRLSYSSLMSFN